MRNGGDLHHVNAKLVENRGDAFFWKKLESVEYGWNPHLDNILIVNQRDPEANPTGGVAVWAPQNEFFYARGITVMNYGNVGALAGCADCDSGESMKQGGYTYRWEGLQWVNSTRRTRWTSPRKAIFWDLDGSLTGEANATATPYYAFNDWPECAQSDATLDDGLFCDSSVVMRRLSMDKVEPRELDWRVVVIDSGAGSDHIDYRPRDTSGWVMPLVEGRRYHTTWDSLVDFRTLRLQFSRPEYVQPGEWLGLSYEFIDTRWQYEVEYTSTGRLVPWLEEPEHLPLRDTTLPGPQHQLGTGLINQVNKTWNVAITTINATRGDTDAYKYSFEAAALQCPPDGCPIPPPPTPGNAERWSSPATWPDGIVPVAGQEVVIPPTQWVLLDVDTPLLGQVVVEGKLTFEDEQDLTLEAMALVVWGTMEVWLVGCLLWCVAPLHLTP